jgi:hypothetical protein
MAVPNGCFIVFPVRRGASIRTMLQERGNVGGQQIYGFEAKAIRS